MDDIDRVDEDRDPFTNANVLKETLVEINSPPAFQ